MPTTTVIEELLLAMDEDLGLSKMNSDKPCSVDNIYKLLLLGPTTLLPQLIPTMSPGAVVKEDHLEAERIFCTEAVTQILISAVNKHGPKLCPT